MYEHLKGRQLWKLRTKHGKDRIFGDPTVLWDEACSFFDWCDRNPREVAELVKYKGGYSEAGVPHGRMYTLSGLSVYLGVSNGYFRTAREELGEKVEKGTATDTEVALLETIERIRLVVQTEQIEGAAVGQYSGSIVTRLNGLSDNVNVTNNSPVLRVSVRDDDTLKYLDELEELL